MRIGPWIFAAGLALLCAGVVSTRADAWDTRMPALTIPLTLAGIDTIDMRDSAIKIVVIAANESPRAQYPGGELYRWRNGESPIAPPACRAMGTTLRCSSGERFLPGEPALHLPPGHYRLLLRDASVRSKTGIDTLALEVSGHVRWAGSAVVLDVALVKPRPGKDVGACELPRFTFEAGRVQSLRVRATAGDLDFGNLSEAGGIEVQAAQDVGLSMDKAADIERIKVSPLASTSVAGGECANAAKAAAMAGID